jgi:hypothetical protein
VLVLQRGKEEMSKIEQFKLSPVGTTGRKFLASRPRCFFHDGRSLIEVDGPAKVAEKMGHLDYARGIVIGK